MDGLLICTDVFLKEGVSSDTSFTKDRFDALDAKYDYLALLEKQNAPVVVPEAPVAPEELKEAAE
jgi:hypothetical protein